MDIRYLILLIQKSKFVFNFKNWDSSKVEQYSSLFYNCQFRQVFLNKSSPNFSFKITYLLI